MSDPPRAELVLVFRTREYMHSVNCLYELKTLLEKPGWERRVLVYEYEGSPPDGGPPPAWATDEARQNAIDERAANTRAFLDGVDRNRVV